jgi:hypothetical protein
MQFGIQILQQEAPPGIEFIIRSWADVELYTYAKYLYTEQSFVFI